MLSGGGMRQGADDHGHGVDGVLSVPGNLIPDGVTMRRWSGRPSRWVRRLSGSERAADGP
jgi:hypothetical protein